MLTQYDEYPVHQYSRPFSEVPSTDVSWDDGYYKSIWSADERIYLNTALRVNPNVDVVGGSVIAAVGGTQYSLRLSRVWRPDCDTRIGPFSYRFVEPFRDIHVSLAANESPICFDFHWYGVAPAFLEAHHTARSRGRFTADQSRYVQVGEPEGWLEVAGERYPIDRNTWAGSRDHSWGLYVPRRPLAGLKEWLPPEEPVSGRALRFWTMFRLPRYSGFFGLHEDRDGISRAFNDYLGTPFEGVIDHGWNRRLELVSARHELTFKPGTRMLTGGTVTVTDVEGGEWVQEFEVATLPYLMFLNGYWPGSWSDGGTIQTYHGPGDVLEWDQLDISGMPMDYQLAHGPLLTNAHGHKYGARLRMTAPDGSVSEGLQHITFWVEGAYPRYGFTETGGFPVAAPPAAGIASDDRRS